MADQAITVSNGATAAPAPLGSIRGSIAYLEAQVWWQGFRDARRLSTQQIDDVLCLGHFCGWLQDRGLVAEQCTETDLDAYLASIAAFRSGPRWAFQRTVGALIDFVSIRPCVLELSDHRQ